MKRRKIFLIYTHFFYKSSYILQYINIIILIYSIHNHFFYYISMFLDSHFGLVIISEKDNSLKYFLVFLCFLKIIFYNSIS